MKRISLHKYSVDNIPAICDVVLLVFNVNHLYIDRPISSGPVSVVASTRGVCDPGPGNRRVSNASTAAAICRKMQRALQ